MEICTEEKIEAAIVDLFLRMLVLWLSLEDWAGVRRIRLVSDVRILHLHTYMFQVSVSESNKITG